MMGRDGQVVEEMERREKRKGREEGGKLRGGARRIQLKSQNKLNGM